MDPWYDSLAFPLAPFVLATQIGALFVRPWWVRIVIALVCTAAIAAMLAYVESRYVPASEGVNIGAGLLALWLGASILLLLFELAREAIQKLWRGFGGPATPPRA